MSKRRSFEKKCFRKIKKQNCWVGRSPSKQWSLPTHWPILDWYLKPSSQLLTRSLTIMSKHLNDPMVFKHAWLLISQVASPVSHSLMSSHSLVSTFLAYPMAHLSAKKAFNISFYSIDDSIKIDSMASASSWVDLPPNELSFQDSYERLSKSHINLILSDCIKS